MGYTNIVCQYTVAYMVLYERNMAWRHGFGVIKQQVVVEGTCATREVDWMRVDEITQRDQTEKRVLTEKNTEAKFIPERQRKKSPHIKTVTSYFFQKSNCHGQ